MKIIIHRGQNQIGGSIVEVATEKTRIVFDAGINLDEKETVDIPEIEGLFSGHKLYDAVFISHYHSDHIGLLDYIVPDIPIFMGEKSYNIFKSASEYRRKSSSFKPTFIYDRTAITVGDITITPFICDHSAFDSYMFLIEADEQKVLYTGDFRANGRLDFDALLSMLPKVEVLIIEGTTLTRESNIANIEEEFLEEIAVKELQKHKGPAFIMMSAMNIDRLITAYNAANATDRIFLEDIYSAEIATSIEEDVPKPNGKLPARVFLTVGGDENYKKLQKFGKAKIGKEEIAKTPFLMCVRSSMINYLKRLNELCSFEDGVLFYGMWKGYMEQESTKAFIEFMKSKGVKLHILHTSGHADELTIERMITTVSPKIIIPIHTENADWFDKYTGIHIVKDCKSITI